MCVCVCVIFVHVLCGEGGGVGASRPEEGVEIELIQL